MQILYFKMWMWILVGLCITIKVHGYSDRLFPQSCESMLPEHRKRNGVLYTPRDTVSPFMVTYKLGSSHREPITVNLKSKGDTQFQGFMLEARLAFNDSRVGNFILLDPQRTRFQKCGDSPDSAVIHTINTRKNDIQVNWTAQGVEGEIIFRATFVQAFETFWERVNATVFLTTSTPQPSTTEQSITESSTADPSTTEPSTTEPSTAKSSTAEPSTTASTAEPSTTASTAEPSATVNTAEPSMTNLSTTTSPNITTLEGAGIAMLASGIVGAAVKMEISNVATVKSSPSHRRTNKVSRILGSVLCATVEIASVILFGIGNYPEVILAALVGLMLVITLTELVIVSLPIGPSHELKDTLDCAAKFCFVAHQILTISVIFAGVWVITDSGENWTESWVLIVMITFTVWIFLSVVWVLVFCTVERSKKGSFKNSNRSAQQSTEKNLCATGGIFTAVSVFLIVGTLAFAVAVIFGIFE